MGQASGFSITRPIVAYAFFRNATSELHCSGIRLSIARLTTFGDDFHVASSKRFEIIQLRQQRR